MSYPPSQKNAQQQYDDAVKQQESRLKNAAVLRKTRELLISEDSDLEDEVKGSVLRRLLFVLAQSKFLDSSNSYRMAADAWTSSTTTGVPVGQ